MDNVKTGEPAIKTTMPDGIELTPVKPLFTPEQEKQLIDSINSPESKNYFVNKAMEEFKNNLDISCELKDIPYRNQNERAVCLLCNFRYICCLEYANYSISR